MSRTQLEPRYTLTQIIEMLKTATRIGQEKDEPEGLRYIQLSDTLVAYIVKSLEELEAKNG